MWIYVDGYFDHETWGAVAGVPGFDLCLGVVVQTMVRESPQVSDGRRARRAKLIRVQLEQCAIDGLTIMQAAERIGVHYQCARTYARKFGIKLLRGNTVPCNTDRAARMAEAYANGSTLEEIGREHGVTRERVRQIIKKFAGMTGVDGGMCVRTQRSAKERFANKDARCLKRFGCTYAQYLQIPLSTRYAYQQKRRNVVRYFGFAAWALTLWDYYCEWCASGMWDRYGRGADNYVMTRIDDTELFAPGNIAIVTHSNLSISTREKKRHAKVKAP